MSSAAVTIGDLRVKEKKINTASQHFLSFSLEFRLCSFFLVPDLCSNTLLYANVGKNMVTRLYSFTYHPY